MISKAAFDRFSRKLDRAVWRIGERVPWWLWVLTPVGMLETWPDALAAQVLALVTALLGAVITFAHREMEREVIQLATLWAADDHL